MNQPRLIVEPRLRLRRAKTNGWPTPDLRVNRRQMLKHNSYFEGKVQSVGFSRLDRSHSVGVIEPGEFRFDTAAAERMTVVSGEFQVKREGDETFTRVGAGGYFEIKSNSYFDVIITGASAYLCEYL